MKLKIKDEIPIKYHLNMHLMESFIEQDSISFELIKYIKDQAESSDKKLDINSFKFTSKTLKYVFGDRMKDELFKEYAVSKLKEMIANGDIILNNKTMVINKDIITKFYNLS